MSKTGARCLWCSVLLVAVTVFCRAAPADTIRQLMLPTRDLVYDPYRQQIYASVPGIAGGALSGRGDSVTVIDPVAGSVGPSVFLGSEPGKLALSGDGQFVYVALDGAGAVRRFQPGTETAGLQFSLGTDPMFGPRLVEDMQVLPGQAGSVALALQFAHVSPRHAGLVVFDNGTPRALATATDPICNSIQFDASGQRLFGLDNETTGFSFTTLSVTPTGVAVRNITPGLISRFGETIHYDAGLIYTSGGEIVDPVRRMVAGVFPGVQWPALVQPDSGTGRVFFLSRMGAVWTLLAYDSQSLQPAGSLPIPGVSGDPGSFIRWGADGFAFRTSANQVFLVRSSLVPAPDFTVTAAPAAVVGGAAAIGRVTLRAPAPAAGATLRLSSTDPAVQLPPAPSLPAGATVAAFPITTSPVAASRDTLITAGGDGTTASTSLRVLAPVPDLLTFAPASVPSGGRATATLALSGPAPAGGLTVYLSTADPAAVSVPASVTLAAGATTAAFSLTTYAVAEKTSVLISASTAEGIYSSPFEVEPPTLRSLTFNPTAVLSGSAAVGTVTLADPAPPGAVTILLDVFYPTITLPASVTVPAGARSATFTVTTVPQAFTQSAYISAHLGSQWLTEPLVIVGPEPATFTLASTTVIGGESTVGRVTLTLPEPASGGGVRFQSSLGFAQVPDTVFLPPGANSLTITVNTLPVTVPTTVKIIAEGVATSVAAPLLLLPAPAASITLDPAAVTGGASVIGTVTLAAPAPPGGTLVNLTSDNAAASVPPQVEVVAGATAALFTITTQPVSSPASARISAAWDAGTAATSLVVQPPSLTSIRIQPDSSTGGLPVTVLITLDGPAPAGGMPVTLASTNPAAPVPSEIVVPPGASATQFSLQTRPVTEVTWLMLSAIAGGQQREWTLRLAPGN